MPSLDILPHEILDSIAGHLLDEKLDHFDLVENASLKNMRLACKVLYTIATPLLFENVVLDFKLCAPSHLNSLITFAIKRPELAKFVHRLHVRVPPPIITMPFLDHDDEDRILASLMVLKGWTVRQVITVHTIIGRRVKKWDAFQKEAYSVPPGNSGSLYPIISTIINNTIRLLPNLRHVEHTLSTHFDKIFRNLESTVLEISGLGVTCDLFAAMPKHFAFEEGLTLILTSLCPLITSLKLREVSVHQSPSENLHLQHQIPQAQSPTLPAALRHLDLQVYSSIRGNRDGPLTTSAWRDILTHAQQLRTLRLSRKPSEYEHNRIYVDSLLVDPESGIMSSHFPHLKHLSFSECSLRLQGLLTIATSHVATLQELELNRVTFDPSSSPKSWSEIGASCKSTLPSLTNLRMAKLTITFPGSKDRNWNKESEIDTSYYWRKGHHGPDVEIIGSGCPWTDKDVIVEDER